jgi:transcriptional regulator with XRE-family HTH domain
MIDAATPTPPSYLTHDDLLTLLAELKSSTSLAELAEAIGISPSFLSNILCGYRRADTPKVLDYLGVEKVTLYTYRKRKVEAAQ